MAKLIFSCDKQTITISIEKKENEFTLSLHNNNNVNDFKAQILSWNRYSQILIFAINGKRHKVHISSVGTMIYATFHTQKTFAITQEPLGSFRTRSAKNSPQQNNTLCAPLAGRVIKQCVSAQQSIKKGQQLVIIESMKMENELRAESDAFIKTIQIKQGDVVQANQVLMTFEDENRSRNKEVE